jgi:nucleoside-diphosphate-sugar epimerase
MSKDIYLVIGGSGFVGRHIVQLLLDRGDSVSVFDIVQRYHDVPFYSGDISEEGSVIQALQKVCTVCLLLQTCFLFLFHRAERRVSFTQRRLLTVLTLPYTGK